MLVNRVFDDSGISELVDAALTSRLQSDLVNQVITNDRNDNKVALQEQKMSKQERFTKYHEAAKSRKTVSTPLSFAKLHGEMQ